MQRAERIVSSLIGRASGAISISVESTSSARYVIGNFLQFTFGDLELFLLDIRDGNVHARVCEGLGGTEPNAAGSTGNEGGFALCKALSSKFL